LYLGVTYSGLNNQNNQAASLQGAAMEASRNPLAIQQQMSVELGRLGVERHDGGATNTGPAVGGSVGMFGNTLRTIGSIATTAAVTAVAGPLAGGAVGFGMAVRDAVSSISSNAGPAPQTDRGIYSLARSYEQFQRPGSERSNRPDDFQYSNPDHDPICANYPSACDGQNYSFGFAAPPRATGAQILTAQKTDNAEERNTKQRIGTLSRQALDLKQEGDTVRGLAPKMGIVVAEGPTPPRMSGIMFSAPAMAI